MNMSLKKKSHKCFLEELKLGIGRQRKTKKPSVKQAWSVVSARLMTRHPQPKTALCFFNSRQEVRCRPGEAASKVPELVSPPQVMWGSTDFQTMADNRGKILSHDTETWGCLPNPESFLTQTSMPCFGGLQCLATSCQGNLKTGLSMC